jgi:hypothetical protein
LKLVVKKVFVLIFIHLLKKNFYVFYIDKKKKKNFNKKKLF